MNAEYILAIDPGKAGGFAALHGNDLIKLAMCPMVNHGRQNEYDIYEMGKLLGEFKDKNAVLYIEKVHSMPREGVSSAFTFGKGYGLWIGIAAAHRIPIRFVTPQEWKRVVLKGTDKSKTASCLTAQQYFPDADFKPGRRVKPHDGLAESALIAVYGGIQEWMPNMPKNSSEK